MAIHLACGHDDGLPHARLADLQAIGYTHTVLATFADRFGSTVGVRRFRAPGRVNLIGEHTDYNDGFVLPVAIDMEAIVVARPRDDRIVSVRSISFDQDVRFDLDNPQPREHGHWANLIEGTARILQSKGCQLRGADIVIDSDIPIGAGLSSSAAVATGTAFALLSLAGIPIDRRAMALACQQAEQESSGALVGIMDPFICVNAREGAALLLDCRSLQFEKVHIDTSHYALVVCDTGIKHELAASAYNDRRRECEEAARLMGVTALRDVSLNEFESTKGILSPLLQKRARHVISENAHTIAAAQAIRDNDFDLMGQLMWESHASLRDDYEVSCLELDILVDTAKTIPGVAGMRMTGGGFGGCTVSFVERGRIDEFSVRMMRAYEEQTGRTLTIHECEIVGGVSEL